MHTERIEAAREAAIEKIVAMLSLPLLAAYDRAVDGFVDDPSFETFRPVTEAIAAVETWRSRTAPGTLGDLDFKLLRQLRNGAATLQAQYRRWRESGEVTISDATVAAMLDQRAAIAHAVRVYT